MALSRFDSSNSSSTIERSAPRSPRKLLERARQPAVAVGEVGAERLLERLRRPCSLTVSAWRRSFSNSARTTSTLTVTPASWSAIRPIRTARSTRSGPVVGRALGEERGERRVVTDSRSTRIRSASTRTRGTAGVSGSSRTVSGGSGSAVMVRRCARSVTACAVTAAWVARPRARARSAAAVRRQRERRSSAAGRGSSASRR